MRRLQAGPCRALGLDEYRKTRDVLIARLEAIQGARRVLPLRGLALLRTCASAGLRMGEALALDVGDVRVMRETRLEGGKTVWLPEVLSTIRLGAGVGEKGDLGIGYLAEGARASIARYLLERGEVGDEGPLFVSERRLRLSYDQARRGLVQAFAEAGLTGQLATHTLRKTFAGLRAFWPLHLVAMALRHRRAADPTFAYLPRPEAWFQEQAEAMFRYLEGEGPAPVLPVAVPALQ